jgi:hypothetical protein
MLILNAITIPSVRTCKPGRVGVQRQFAKTPEARNGGNVHFGTDTGGATAHLQTRNNLNAIISEVPNPPRRRVYLLAKSFHSLPSIRTLATSLISTECNVQDN